MLRVGLNCQVLGRCHSGVERYCLGLVRCLAHAAPGNEYTVFARGGAGQQDQAAPLANVRIRESSSLLGVRLVRIGWEHAVLPFLARRHRLDLLHCPAYICPLTKVVPTVITVHDTFALDHPQWCKPTNTLYYGLTLRRSIADADHVIVLSHRSREAVIRHVPQAASRISVVYPGIDAAFVPVREAGCLDAVRRRYRLPPRYILYVGNLEPRKNLPRLVEAFQRFRRSQPAGWGLVVVGGKAWRIRRSLAQMNGAGHLEAVCFTGYVPQEDLPSLYSMAEVFAFPSLDEGFGFPPLEAMACGTPVVASSRGALRETLAGAALYADALSVESISDGLAAVVRDRDLRSRLVEDGLRHVRRFRWQEIARQTLAVYDRVLSGGRQGGASGLPSGARRTPADGMAADV